MPDPKKAMWAILLVVIIVAVIAFSVWRRQTAGQQPAALRDEVYTLIDENMLEVFEKTRGELASEGAQNYRYKNPKTGEYTLRVAAPCTSCGKLIPGVSPDIQTLVCPYCKEQVWPPRPAPASRQ